MKDHMSAYKQVDIEFLSKEKEKALLIKAKDGCIDSRNQLLESHIPFMLKMCHRFKPLDMDAELFMSDAVEGFIKAIETCKPNHPCRLSTWARFRVSRHILRSEFHKRTIGIPYGVRYSYRKLQEAKMLLFVDKGCVLIDTLAKTSEFTESEILRLERCQQFTFDLLSLDNDDGYIDIIADDSDFTEMVCLQLDAEHFLSRLNNRERYIVSRKYGIDEELTFTEIGKRLGITGTQVSKIFKRAMRKLRDYAQRLIPMESLSH